MTTIKNVLLLLALLVGLSLQDSERLTADSKLFNKDRSIDKIVIKHQIGYHFRKIVRTVQQELFISRKLSVMPIIDGIHALERAHSQLTEFCDKLSKYEENKGKQPDYSPRYSGSANDNQLYYIKDAKMSTFSVVKARCHALGLRLPEVYTKSEAEGLRLFLEANKLSHCFAGIEYDLQEHIQKFITTGYPIWFGYFQNVSLWQDSLYEAGIKPTLDDVHARFMYTSKGRLETFVPDLIGKIGGNAFSTVYWNTHSDIGQAVAPVICASPWDGSGLDNLEPSRSIPGITVTNYKTRLPRSTDKVVALTTSSGRLTNVCRSHAAQLKESFTDLNRKMTDVLYLVDISVHLRNDNYSGKRRKRNAEQNTETPGFIFKSGQSLLQKRSLLRRRRRRAVRSKRALGFVFKAGLSLLWNVFGIYQGIQTERRIKKLETAMTITRKDVERNSALLSNMTEIIYDHSVVINDLQFATQQVTSRVGALEKDVSKLTLGLKVVNHRVDRLEQKVDYLAHDLAATQRQVDQLAAGLVNANQDMEILLTLSTISSATTRIDNSLNKGYLDLKDIIHSSLRGATSPLILPPDQIQLVQNEINMVSSSVLDTDFGRMNSIVVSHPKDPSCLLIVVNAAALSRNSLELVQLMPVPFYSGKMAHMPILDYTAIVLNQIAQSFTVLSRQEMDDCMDNRCYIGNMAQPLSSISCGAPQYFNRSVEACEYESRASSGVSVINVAPDGFIFSFESECSVQLFGRNGHTIGKPRKLSGMGTIQIPTGCSLIVTNQEGQPFMVFGQPQYYSMDAAELDVTTSNVLSSPPTSYGSLGPPRRPTLETDEELERQVITVQQAVDDTRGKVENQAHHVWILTGCLTSVVAITIVLAIVLYHNSKRFRKKVKAVRQTIEDLSRQIGDAVKPHVPPRSPLVSALRKTKSAASRIRRHRTSTVRISAPNTEYLQLDETWPRRTRGKTRIYESLPRRCNTLPPKLSSVYPTVPSESELKDGYETGFTSGSSPDVRFRSVEDAVSITSHEHSLPPTDGASEVENEPNKN